MAEVSIALAAKGADEQAFLAWGTRAVGRENTYQWGSGKDILNHLIQATNGGQNCIKRLYVFSHAWAYMPNGNRGGVKLGGIDVAGFYSAPGPYDHRDARYIKDLRDEVRAGRIRFCPSCTVTFTGCRVASSNFPQEFVRISRCKVIASNGSSHPKPGNPPGDETGIWLSTAGGWEEQLAKANEQLDVGWMEYELRGDGEVAVKSLGEQIKVW